MTWSGVSHQPQQVIGRNADDTDRFVEASQGKGDVSGAFLQGREYPDVLHCIPTKEICEAMSIPENSVTRLRRACYGLVDAPLEWYRTVDAFFQEIGLERTQSDACVWCYRHEGQLIGCISGHVDDFIFAGSDQHEGWREVLKKIQSRFQWGGLGGRPFYSVRGSH